VGHGLLFNPIILKASATTLFPTRLFLNVRRRFSFQTDHFGNAGDGFLFKPVIMKALATVFFSNRSL